MNTKYILSKFSTAKTYDVKNATEILQQYGISHNEKKTRDLIAKGKLAAKSKGNPSDRRAGFLVTEKALYDLVVTEIPIMREFFEHTATDKTKKKIGTSTKKSPIEQVKAEEESKL